MVNFYGESASDETAGSPKGYVSLFDEFFHLILNITVLLLQKLPYSLTAQPRFLLLQQLQQLLQLRVVDLFDLVADSHFPFDVFRRIHPIQAVILPTLPVAGVFEDCGELLQGLLGGFVLSVEYEIVVLRQNGNQTLFGVLERPGKLIQKMKDFLIINSIPRNTIDSVQDGIKINFPLRHLRQHYLSDELTIFQSIKPWYIQHPETHLIPFHFGRGRLIVSGLSSHRVGRIAYLYVLASCQLLGGG